jgi:hypothetical protein
MRASYALGLATPCSSSSRATKAARGQAGEIECQATRQVLLSCRQVGLTEATENARSNPMTAQWLPKGFHTITPNIVADDAEGAVIYDPSGSVPIHVHHACYPDRSYFSMTPQAMRAPEFPAGSVL